MTTDKVLFVVLLSGGMIPIYGESVEDVVAQIERRFRDGNLLVIVRGRAGHGDKVHEAPIALRIDDIASVVEGEKVEPPTAQPVVLFGAPCPPGLN